MRKIEPFESVAEALATLDNGGQFYNFLTHAEDGLISTAEVSKVAGLFVGKKQVVLYLQLVLSKLSQADLEVVFSKFDESLKLCYREYAGKRLAIDELDDSLDIGAAVVLQGSAWPATDRSELHGFVFIMAAGAMMPVPIIEAYDIYRFTDASNAAFPVVHTKGKAPFPSDRITIAGVVKELKSEKKGERAKRYVEACYYVLS
ncbi:hypothetical protein PQ465_09130 [Sphingobacterium oryzagri]|uniref:Uncharacterized protein n=1 Tax=Sphingobacterium oryzagri TaxID=3025669 RepID=A0ABY7WLZ7_9SPHI|nr:hypothetical protein [Sphingobacterium sp. KACC 22765]WDF70520.1 hypothetical protein PQ465_09130 [Sphingobacterium sp. KACC 22765]